MNLLRFKKDDPTYGFLSNYYPCSFVLDGIYYLNAEAAFQAEKVPPEERRQFACLMSDMITVPATLTHSVNRERGNKPCFSII